MLEIDGARGEGGGQVLRSSLTLSAITGKPFHIRNIRLNRSRPGLRPQHLNAVEGVAEICKAGVTGAVIGATELIFQPGPASARTYRFDIGTAGAASLVLQTILPVLVRAEQKSVVTVSGGTHVPWSPCFEYLAWHWSSFLDHAGIEVDLTMEQAGFYPRGGGVVRAEIHPAAVVRPIVMTERGELVGIRGLSASAALPDHIADRQRRQALKRLADRYPVSGIETSRLAAHSPGTVLLLLARFEQGQCCFFGLGEKGKPAERVADEAVDQLENFLATGAAVDHFLADQLLLPLALAAEPSRFTTSRVSRHLLTNAEVVRLFLPVEITVRERTDRPVLVEVCRA